MIRRIDDGSITLPASSRITFTTRRNIQIEKFLSMIQAAISCGIHKGEVVLDLDYEEDSGAETDANFVMTGKGGIVEVQGTAEGEPFSKERFLDLLTLAQQGIGELVALQKQAVR